MLRSRPSWACELKYVDAHFEGTLDVVTPLVGV